MFVYVRTYVCVLCVCICVWFVCMYVCIVCLPNLCLLCDSYVHMSVLHCISCLPTYVREYICTVPFLSSSNGDGSVVMGHRQDTRSSEGKASQ